MEKQLHVIPTNHYYSLVIYISSTDSGESKRVYGQGGNYHGSETTRDS